MVKKIILWIVGLIVFVLVFLWFLGAYGYKIQNYFMVQRQGKFLADLKKQSAEILEMQKNDSYGGKTPEETLDLYIQALKAGDIELASKYYEISIENPNLQVRELEVLKNVINRDGDLDLVIEEVENIRNHGKKNIWSDSESSFIYEFTTEKEIVDVSIVSREEITTIIPVGTKLEVGNALKLNSYTKVWKIIQ